MLKFGLIVAQKTRALCNKNEVNFQINMQHNIFSKNSSGIEIEVYGTFSSS